MSTLLRTLTFTTGSIAAGTSSSTNQAIDGNFIDIAKIKVVPSNLNPSELTVFTLYKHNTFLAADIAYNTVAFPGNLIDPVETDGVTFSERNEGYVAYYEDADNTQQLHCKITNSGSQAKTYTVTIEYKLSSDQSNDTQIVDITNQVILPQPGVSITGAILDFTFSIIKTDKRITLQVDGEFIIPPGIGNTLNVKIPSQYSAAPASPSFPTGEWVAGTCVYQADVIAHPEVTKCIGMYLQTPDWTLLQIALFDANLNTTGGHIFVSGQMTYSTA